MKSAIDQQKKYKEQLKIQKLADKLQEKLNKRAATIRQQYEALKEKRIQQISEAYERKLQKRLSKVAREYDRKRIDTKKKIQGKEVKKKEPTIGKIKQEAYTIYQYWRKLSLANSDGMLWTADGKGWYHWSKCVAGHIYSKSGNGHMAFLDMNVRPITRDTNRIQGTSPGIYWAVNVLDQKELLYLKGLSENKILKNEIRDRNFYQEKYDHYLKLSKKEEIRLGIV